MAGIWQGWGLREGEMRQKLLYTLYHFLGTPPGGVIKNLPPIGGYMRPDFWSGNQDLTWHRFLSHHRQLLSLHKRRARVSQEKPSHCSGRPSAKTKKFFK